ncbi:Ethylene-insensitive protein 2 [Salvia divinorum]|uniref:Ethylene-insensitive protein 2 n=1 Tax=Salvia divinorum TaxID=28513 RepID=A0ABD1GZ24_SALDI
MEYETQITDYQPSSRGRVLAAVGPVLWIAISYVDPGKWAASIEGGARIGFDLSLLVFIVNCAAILCQYLSARVAIATGKNLAQICSDEYNDLTCILLGIQAEISMIVLDLTMILGSAYGLNAVLGIDLFNCVFLTGFDAILFPLLASFLGNPKAKILYICLACFVLASYGSGILVSQSESSLSTGGILNKLTGENVYTLMSIVGANIMPHNLYLHSSIVQGEGQIDVSKEALCYDQFFATLCIFSGIFLLNSMLVNLAANVFYSSGIISLTSQDALSLLDQGFRSTLASVALIFIMFVSNQLVSVSWCLGRQVTTPDFFRFEIPDWLHRATVRIIAIIPALFCVWNSGAEGIFQLLICTQVVVALLLPSSVIPLFRVASSRSIMGMYKNSLLVEFFALVSFICLLGLKIVFVIELLFGSSDWVVSLRWNIGSTVPVSYIILLKVALSSLCLTLWLAITPLKSASSGLDTQAMEWDSKVAVIDPSVERGQTEVSEIQHRWEKCVEKQEVALSSERFSGSHHNFRLPTPDLNLPETLLDSEVNIDLTTIEENTSDITFSKPAPGNPEVPATISESASPGSGVIDTSGSLIDVDLSTVSKDMVEKTLRIEGDVQNEKDYEADQWKPQESIKDISESDLSLSSDGPGSFRSIGGKNDDLGSGAGSLSRIAGLGRAARRQLTAILDEFWGQLFDFHGQVTHEAKAKKLDVLLGVDSKGDSKSLFASVKLESFSPGGRGPDLVRTPSFYSSSMQHIGQSSIASPLGVRQGSPMLSNRMHLNDAYVRTSSHSTLDNSERRYHSVHIPSLSDGFDQQPATIHGYDMASYMGRMAKEKGSDYQKGQLESLKQTSVPSVKSNSVDSYSRPSGQKPQNGLSKPPGFHNVPVSVSRISSLKSERPLQDISSHEPVDYNNNSPNVKKFYSLPDISGLYVPHRASFSNKSSQLENSMGYGQSVSRPAREQMSSSASWVGPALGFNEFSPPKVCSDAFSLQLNSGSGAGSLWSKQPYEQFGVADKSPSKIPEAASLSEMEAKLLQSFRSCIMRLLKLEGSDWLFRQNDGADEDLIDRVAARERILYEAETRSVDRKLITAMRIDETDMSKFMSVPNCGDGCVWRVDLTISFGVWCIHKILDLSLVESRPELWGKYTYVLNRLQGVIDLAFTKPRSPMAPCFCLQLPVEYQQKSSPPISNGSLPPPSKSGRGKFTSAAMLVETVKDVEQAISCRKGRTGTAAGDVAFPKGKENLASVLKRYKRRLSNKPVGEKAEGGHGLRKVGGLSSHQGLC